VRYCTSCLAIYRTDFDRCPLDGGALALGAQDPLIGTFVGDYVIDDKIGEGGMGRVYRAHRIADTTRRVALKVLLGDLAASSLMRQRFAREAEAARHLSHPNIVGVLDYGHTLAGLPFLVMDLVDGTDLAAILQRGPMAAERVIRIARQLCEGLHHAHSHGVIHRDFKPDNILVVDEGEHEQVRIADFGLALSSADDTRLTMTGVACTPAYAAPEQLRGQTIDGRVDLYALGTTMFEMLTGGMLPFESDLQGTIRLKLAGEAPSLMTIVPDMQPALSTLVARLLSHDPHRRPRSAKSLIVALDAALRAPKRKIRTADLAHEKKSIEISFPPVPRKRAATTRRMRKQATYGRRTLAALAGGAMMVGAALAMIFHDGRTTREHADDTAIVTMQAVSTPLDLPAVQAMQPAVTRSLEVEPVLVQPISIAPVAKRVRRAHRARPDPVDIATKYGAIGRELQQLQRDRGDASTADLWPSYKRIQIGDAISTPASREATDAHLDQIEAAITERRTR